VLQDRLNILNMLDSNILTIAIDVDARIEHYDSSVTERVAVDAVIAATFWPGVQVKISGKFAGNSVSVATAVGVPSPMRTLHAAVATSST
jgi:hypothetical protein